MGREKKLRMQEREGFRVGKERKECDGKEKVEKRYKEG